MCRSLSQVATSRLYRHLILPYYESDPGWKWLEPLYDNKGLQFVRDIEIGYSDLVCKYGVYNICRPLERLLSSLRHDSLEGLRHGVHGKLSHNQMSRLWRTQKRLKEVHIEINNGTGSWTVEGLRNEGLRELQSLKLVEELSLSLGAPTNVKEYAELQVLMNLNKIQRVTLDIEELFRQHNGRTRYRKRLLDYYSFSRLFPINLRSITLFTVVLPTDETVQLEDWVNLTELSLFGCANVAPMLADLRSHKLTTFICRDLHMSTAELNEAGDRLRAISSVLSRSKTLEALGLDLRDLKSDDMETIAFGQSLRCHKQTLTSMAICSPLFCRFSDDVLDCTELIELALWVNLNRAVSTCEVREMIRSKQKVQYLKLILCRPSLGG